MTRLSLALFCSSLALSAVVFGQSATVCLPVQIPQLSGQNMFTPEQEKQLGDILAEQFDRQYGVLDDDVITGHMQQITDRLLASLPPHVPVQVFLTNESVLNAWSLPGRIYVTRKLVAFTASEDELADSLPMN